MDRAYQNVIEYIKSEIKSGVLQCGSRLPSEREISARLGVGRSSVREGVRTLENLGIITSVRGSGNFVAENFEKCLGQSISMFLMLKNTGARQIYDVRHSLEELACVRAGQFISANGKKRLLRLAVDLSCTEDEKKAAALDRDIHFCIARAAENPMLTHLLNVLSDAVEDFIIEIRRQITADADNRRLLADIHLALAEAIAENDSSKLNAAIKQHHEITMKYIDMVNMQ